MLSRLLRQVLFILVHFVVNILVAVQNVYHRFWIRKNIESGGEGMINSIKVILKHIPHVSKKPKHLVIEADTNHHSLQELAAVVIWSLVAGIPFVSFYDITGDLKRKEEKFFLEVEKCKKGIPGCIKWSKMPNLNGYTNGSPAHTIITNIFTQYDGRAKITECIRKIAENKVKYKMESNLFTAQELDEVLQNSYPSIPEPDLVLFTGRLCCTYGLLPWQIRLTEFVNLSIDHSINVVSYIGALYKYNKCDQRFGK